MAGLANVVARYGAVSLLIVEGVGWAEEILLTWKKASNLNDEFVKAESNPANSTLRI
jgi:hypothetical protein